MDATETQRDRTRITGSTARSAEVLEALSALETASAATNHALKHATEAVDAQLRVFVDGDLTESTTTEITLVVPVRGRVRGHLVLARSGPDFTAAEREEIQAVARALSLYEPGVGRDLLDRLTLQDELVLGLQRGEIQTYFLPKVELRTARVTGVEALVRWAHPERGVLPPVDFLYLAESAGLMPAITERVIELGARAAGDWLRSGLQLELSVNLPASALTDPGPHFEEGVRAALSGSGLPAESLRFDVPEDAVMRASDPSDGLLRLTEIGASISIDDFGTGHAALGRLKRLAVDELKIDRSLIRALTRGGDKALVRSTIHLARQLGIRVVAEGVESEDTWRQLRGMGCDTAQGHLIGAPMPAREFLAWIASWNARGRELNTISREHLEVPQRRGRDRSHPRDHIPA
ncbi:MAG TPA: EAL domain-containing protein [Solirubrobacterales bacterium]|jgi:EAL domain-containing protein (putative c-di-GMP-specific phosphodiesterase class I)